MKLDYLTSNPFENKEFDKYWTDKKEDDSEVENEDI